MRVLLATGIYPPEIGGPATVIAKLSDDLRSRGHEVLVVTYGDTPLSADGVIRVSRTGSVAVRYIRFACAIRRSMRPGTIVFSTDVFSTGIPTRFALIGRSHTLVLRLGGDWAWEDAVTKGGLRVTLREYWKDHAHGAQHALKVFFYRWIIHRAKMVCVTSEMLREVVMQAVPGSGSRIVVVPNVASTICPHPRNDQPPHRPFHLIFIGRFAPVKNVPFLARVLRLCNERGIDVACTFVGDGPELPEVTSLLDGIPQMTFTGRLPQAEISRLLGGSDLHVLPSLTDICPNSVIEALSCGVPCLVTSEHGLPQGIGGLVEASPKDEEAWVQAIAELIDLHSYEELRRKILLPATTDGLCDRLERL